VPFKPGGPILALLGLIAFGAVVAWFGIGRPQGPGKTEAPRPVEVSQGPASPPQATNEQQTDQTRQAPAQEPAQPVETPRGPPRHSTPIPLPQGRGDAPADPGKPEGPSFDIVRIEPTGESVIAGRGAPGATIEMLRNGKSHARSLADASGLFALVPPLLTPGAHELGLTSIAPDGTRAQSRESVTVVINEDRTRKPLVTLTSPDRPTVVLSAPEGPDVKKPQGSEPAGAEAGAVTAAAPPEPSSQPPAAPAGPVTQPPPAARPGVKIKSVEAEEGGRLYVSGDAAANATVRLYLNDSFIAPGGTGSDGKVSFAIRRGVRPGEYRVRLDDVDPVSGEVRSRAEVAFNVPPPLTVPLPPHPEPLAGQADLASSVARLMQPPGQAPALSPMPGESPAKSPGEAAVSSSGASAREAEPGMVIVPQITTATVSRGENLWRISRRIYGEGTRYTVIYDANQAQIRNPNRIYPGQIFVLPAEEAPAELPRTEP
jgi:nucleoid-associated protein YgaU